MYHVDFNREQMTFMRKEAQAWISVQHEDNRFDEDQIEAEDHPLYLQEVGLMFGLVGKAKLYPDGGSMTIHPGTAYSLLCYVEFDGEERAADPNEGISVENMRDYVRQLESVVEQSHVMYSNMISYADEVKASQPDWEPRDIVEDTVEEMLHRYGEDQGREYVLSKVNAHCNELYLELTKTPKKVAA